MLVTCSKCKKEVAFVLFGPNSKKKNGLNSDCNACRNEKNKIRYNDNPEKYRQMCRNWRKNNPDKQQAASKSWRERNTDEAIASTKRWREENSARFKEVKCFYNSKPENKQRAAEIALLWRAKNKDLIRQKERERRKLDPQFRLRRNIRRRLKKVLDIQAKYRETGRVVGGSGWGDKGCSDAEFIKHIEAFWEPWMNWTNYGNGVTEWNIDHVKPLKNFDLTKREEYLKAVHYTNIRPLHSRINFSKGCKEIV